MCLVALVDPVGVGPFSGKDPISFREWARRAEVLLHPRFGRLPPGDTLNEYKAIHITAYFTDAAYTFFESRPLEVKNNWPRIHDEMCNRFPGVDAGVTKDQAMEDLFRLQQRDHESVVEYGDRAATISTNLGMPDKDASAWIFWVVRYDIVLQ